MPAISVYELVTELAACRARRAPEEAGEMLAMVQTGQFDPILFALWLQLEGFYGEERWMGLLDMAIAAARRRGAAGMADSLN